jgi:hypothetical protein
LVAVQAHLDLPQSWVQLTCDQLLQLLLLLLLEF